MSYALSHCIIHTGHATLTEHALLIEGDRIAATMPRLELPQTVEVIDLNGQHVAPGFVDLQLNGCGGVMFNDTITAETLDMMHKTNLASGTTSFLPTLITTTDEDMIAAIDVVEAYRKHYPQRVLGLHLEGPYLNPKRKGIHNERYIRPPDRAMIDRICNAGRDVVAMITLAPEQVDAAMIQQLAQAGIVVSAGHTDATFEQAIAGFEAGVGMVTHLFNAMTPWLGRNPGMVGAVFGRPDVYAGMIADGLHVHYASVGLAQRLKGDRLLLVTDATPPVGTQMESFWIGGQEVFYHDGKCVSADGTLGGSALTMIEAVANCVQQLGLPLDEALRMASTYPARAIRAEHLGEIAPTHYANLAIFDDDFHITATVDRGHYDAGPKATALPHSRRRL